MFALTLVFICIILAALGQISMKKGMTQIDKIDNLSDLIKPSTLFHMLTNIYVFIGLLLYAVSAFLWLGALSQLDVSLMYPLLSLGYVITAILAFIFLKENITLLRWLGIVLVVIGSFLVIRT